MNKYFEYQPEIDGQVAFVVKLVLNNDARISETVKRRICDLLNTGDTLPQQIVADPDHLLPSVKEAVDHYIDKFNSPLITLTL